MIICFCFLCCILLCWTELVGGIVLPKKVLVIGGNGRVGAQIVSKLVQEGITTNALVRDLSAAQSNLHLTGANLIPGDVNNIDDLRKCIKGCDTVISVHGMKPPRFRKIFDWIPGFAEKDNSHPFNLNYHSIRKILLIMQQEKASKFVRLTGSLAGRNPFNPFVFLFNFLLSDVITWNEFGEMAIRNAARLFHINYTVVRAPGISNDPALASLPHHMSANKSLELFCADSLDKPLPSRRKISFQDIATICLLSAMDTRLTNTTILVQWNEERDGAKDWLTLLNQTKVSEMLLILIQIHRIIVLSFFIRSNKTLKS